MNVGNIFRISGSALDAQKKRLEVIAENLAGADVTRTPEGGPYHRKEVVFETFGGHLSRAQGKGDQIRTRVELDPRPMREVYAPGHPDANAQGYVQMPNVNVMEEMANMINASRSYEADVKVIDAAKSMTVKALEIGQ